MWSERLEESGLDRHLFDELHCDPELRILPLPTRVPPSTIVETISANPPANAEVGDSFESAIEIYDSLGPTSNATVTRTETAENAWAASVSDPTSPDDTSTSVGTVTSSDITITFTEDGTLASTSPSPATPTISGWSSGVEDSTITLDLGDAGTASGLSRYSSTDDDLIVAATVTQDGIAYGTRSSVSVEDDGTATLDVAGTNGAGTVSGATRSNRRPPTPTRSSRR